MSNDANVIVISPGLATPPVYSRPTEHCMRIYVIVVETCMRAARSSLTSGLIAVFQFTFAGIHNA